MGDRSVQLASLHGSVIDDFVFRNSVSSVMRHHQKNRVTGFSFLRIARNVFLLFLSEFFDHLIGRVVKMSDY